MTLTIKPSSWIATTLFAALVISQAWATSPVLVNPIGNFHEVESGIYRGQRPGEAGIAYLASIGVKTVIDLENDMNAVAAETQFARDVGIQVISQPMSGFWTPRTATVNSALETLENPANYPIFVHCLHGQDRTGLIIGLFRVESEKWAPARAFREMRANGFHSSLFLLNHYFETRTGFDD